MTIKGTYDTGKASIFSSRPSKSQATDKKVLFGLSRKGGKKGGRESTEALTQIGQVTSMVQTAPEVNGERAPQKRRQSTIIVDETEEEDEEMKKSEQQIFYWALGLTIGYLGLGVLVFSLWEKWSFLDTFYFVVVTLTTVGYGDQDAWMSEGAMFFCTIYAFCGILLLGTALGIIAAEIMEARDEAIKKAQRLALEEMAATMCEGKGTERHMTMLQLGEDLNVQFEHIFAPIKRMYNNNTTPLVRTLVPSFCVLVVVLSAGMLLIYCDDNSLGFIPCLYFAVITSTTIGYGDYSPSTDGGKAAGIVFLLVGVTAVTNVLSTIAGAIIDAKQKAAMEKVLAKKITLEDFRKFDVDGDGRIEKTEFVVRKLLLMGLIHAQDIQRVEEEFDHMDVDGSGEITFEDLAVHIKKKAVSKKRASSKEGAYNV